MRFIRLRPTWFFVLMLAVFSLPAKAETLKLDTISVELALPRDYCALSRSDPQDKQRYEQQERANGGRNVVLMIATPCDEVAASRAGENLRHWATWLQSGSPDRPLEVPGLARTEVFTEIAKNMPTTDVKKLVEEVDARTRKEGISVKSDKLVIVGQDGSGLYGAMAGDVSDGTITRTLAGVLAWTVLSDRIFTFNLFCDYENQQSFDTLLVSVKDVAQRSSAATDALRTTR